MNINQRSAKSGVHALVGTRATWRPSGVSADVREACTLCFERAAAYGFIETSVLERITRISLVTSWLKLPDPFSRTAWWAPKAPLRFESHPDTFGLLHEREAGTRTALTISITLRALNALIGHGLRQVVKQFLQVFRDQLTADVFIG